MQAVWLAITTIGALIIVIIGFHLRKKRPNEQNRWAWWKEFHQRMRRYPTSQEVDDWISEQTGATPLCPPSRFPVRYRNHGDPGHT